MRTRIAGITVVIPKLGAAFGVFVAQAKRWMRQGLM